MSFAASQDVKEQVRQATDIVDLVGSYVSEMRREGRMYKVLCPWHNDTRPSLQINPERQSWKCWVCDLVGVGQPRGHDVAHPDGGDDHGVFTLLPKVDFPFTAADMAVA